MHIKIRGGWKRRTKMIRLRTNSRSSQKTYPIYIPVLLAILSIWASTNVSLQYQYFVFDAEIRDGEVAGEPVAETENCRNQHHHRTQIPSIGAIEEEEPEEPCALLFFGLVKQFKSVVLPSIRSNIIEPNRRCDIFLHTYNLTQIPVNDRNQESNLTTMDVSEAYLIADAAVCAIGTSSVTVDIEIESMESFEAKRADVLHRTRKNYCHSWGNCCTSHDNMIKQWNSIHGAWALMEKKEKKELLLWNHTGEINLDDGTFYKQVGIFRSDVFYPHPIRMGHATAVVPSFGSNGGVNDRLFYGKRIHAKKWASKRFEFIPEFEKRYMVRNVKKFNHGYHSETYLKNLLKHYSVPAERNEICAMRVREGIRVDDCAEYPEFKSLRKVKSLFPKELQNITLLRAEQLSP